MPDQQREVIVLISPLYAIVDPLDIDAAVKPPIKFLAFRVKDGEFGIPLSHRLTLLALEANGDLTDIPYELATYSPNTSSVPWPRDGFSWRLLHKSDYVAD